MSQVKMGGGGDAREAELAREIKSFRKTFKGEHGRDPSRKDMNKFPEIAKAYDAWLAIKSNSTASTSTLPPSSSSSTSAQTLLKRKAAVSSTGVSPRKKKAPFSSAAKDGVETSQTSSSMAPPPTTPSKEKKYKKVTYEASGSSAFITPTKKAAKVTPSMESPSSVVHDSGGSVIDVPSTPTGSAGRGERKAGVATSPLSPSASRSRALLPQHRRQTSRTFESPSKVRALLSSFSSIHRTPTKDDNVAEDAQIMQRLTKGPLPAYTPRTKARKRLRGEVVVTPEKNGTSNERGTNNHVAREPGRIDLQGGSQLPAHQKKRRGMATSSTTLRDYGIVPVAAPKARGGNEGQHRWGKKQHGGGKLQQVNTVIDEHGKEQNGALDEDEDEEDMLGPSPSVNRVVNRPIKSFQPLFGLSTGDMAGGIDDDMAEDEGVEGRKEADGAEVQPAEQATHVETTSNGGNVVQKGESIVEDGEDSNIIVVPYRPYGRNNSYQRRGAAFSEEENDDFEDEDNVGLHYYGGIVPGLAHASGRGRDESTSPLPPANVHDEDSDDDDDQDADTEQPILDNLSLNSPQMKKQRQHQRARNERNLRNLLGTDDKLQPLDDWEEHQAEKSGKNSNLQPKTNKVGPPIKGGKLRKGFKDLKSNISTKVKESPASLPSKLVLQNTRDQLGSDEESIYDDDDRDLDHDYDDEWASDVDSAEYGLGDGYMSDL